MQFKNVVKEKFDISTSIDILPEKLEAYSSLEAVLILMANILFLVG